MNFQVPSYPLAIPTGYSLFSLKIQRILRIFRYEAVYLILFGVKSLKHAFNNRICFPHVQTIRLTQKNQTFYLFSSILKLPSFLALMPKMKKMVANLKRRRKIKMLFFGCQMNHLDIRKTDSIIKNAFTRF
jgi:hypothetical protein